MDNSLFLECGICLDNKELNSIVFLPCIHFLCSDCHGKLHKHECPFCRTKIEEEYDSFDEKENEYSDVNFEILVYEEKTRRRKKNKKKLLKLVNNNNEYIVSINRNSFTVLQGIN